MRKFEQESTSCRKTQDKERVQSKEMCVLSADDASVQTSPNKLKERTSSSVRTDVVIDSLALRFGPSVADIKVSLKPGNQTTAVSKKENVREKIINKYSNLMKSIHSTTVSSHEKPISKTSKITVKPLSPINSNLPRSSTRCTPIKVQSEPTVSSRPPKVPCVCIPGYDRIINQNYPRWGKFLWISFFTMCLFYSLYQCGSCVSSYFADDPAVSLVFEKVTDIWVPSPSFCPSNIFGKTGKEIARLQKKYCSIPTVNDERCKDEDKRKDISAVDTFYPPLITMEDIWNSHNFTSDDITLENICTTTKGDTSCSAPYIKTEVMTASGKCLRIDTTKKAVGTGPVALLKFTFIPKTIPDIWEPYLRVFQTTIEEDITYYKLNTGISTPIQVTTRGIVTATHIRNLNLPSNPCDDGASVERCFNTCMDEKLNSSLPCRLPFMKTKTLNDCETPKKFKQAINSMKKILNERNLCFQKCPRKCHKILFSVNVDVQEWHPSKNVLEFSASYWDLLEPSVKEYLWYTLFYLFSNVGGSLGFFLNIGLLTMFEILEAFIHVCKTKRSDNHGIYDPRPLTNAYYGPLISITGFDRILKRFSKMKLKIVWIIVLIISSSICFSQIHDMYSNYLYGAPAVRTAFEENEFLELPAITICPYRPFDYYENILHLKEEYQNLYNLSNELNEIEVIELLKMNYTLEELWNMTQPRINFKQFDPNCKEVMNQDSIDVYKETVVKLSETIFGTCFTIFVDKLRFKGVSTGICIVSEPSHELMISEYMAIIVIHNREDDPRTVDLGSIPQLLAFQNFVVFPLEFRKKSVLSRLNNPCEDSEVVADCRKKCTDDYFAVNAPCRLPFMDNKTIEDCTTPEGFNQSMEVARKFYLNFNLDFCPCFRKCNETFIEVTSDTLSSKFHIPLNILVFYFRTNLFLYTEEYEQTDIFTLFAGICGSLGLFIDICTMTILEIIEFVFVLVLRLLNKTKTEVIQLI